MKVREVILRAMAKRITWWQEAEILGITDRSIRLICGTAPAFPKGPSYPISQARLVPPPNRRHGHVKSAGRSPRHSVRDARATSGSTRRCIDS